MDMLRDTGFPLHKDVQIVGIEHEQACSREGNNGRGSARPTQADATMRPSTVTGTTSP